MRILVIILLVVVAVVALQWALGQRQVAGAEDVRQEVRSALDKAKDAMDDVDVEAVKDELARTGVVVRRKVVAASKTIAEATEDARTTAAIKAKLAADPGLSALEISVDTTDGRVTLAGRADSAEAVARAMRIALEQDNVQEVVSTIQVRGQGFAEPQKATAQP